MAGNGRGQRGSREIPRGLKGDWRKLAERMRDLGWTFEDARRVKAFSPDGTLLLTIAKTPSDVAAFRNARAMFRAWCREQGVEPGI